MTVNTAYEVQVRRGDDWTIESAFEDEATAVDTAKRRDRMNGNTTVRVVCETHDENTGQSSFKVCYRSGTAFHTTAPATPENAPAAKAREQPTNRPRTHARVRPHATRSRLGIRAKMAFLLIIAVALFAGLQVGKFLT